MRSASSVVVRPATPDDVSAVTALRLALLEEERKSQLFAHPHPRVGERARALSAAQLAGEREVIFLAMVSGRPGGVLRCVMMRGSLLVQEGSYGAVTTVYVRPEYRRRGVLRALLGAADEWCRAHRLPEMRLHATVENVVGRSVWRALGFAPAEVLYRRTVPSS